MGLSESELKEYQEKGVKKEFLIDGAYYFGHCRNASVARWDKEMNQFYYNRTKWGSTFVESLPGPEDAIDGMDYFLPENLVLDMAGVDAIEPHKDTRGYGHRWNK